MPPLRTPLDGLTVEVDWDANNTWADARVDITQYVRSIEWRCGAMTRDQLVAPAMECTIVLDNSDSLGQELLITSRVIDGTVQAGTLVEIPMISVLDYGMLVRVKHSSATTTNNVLLLGRITNVSYSVGADFSRTATITLSDWHDELTSIVYDPPFSTSVTTGQLVSSMFDNAAVAYPYAGSWWLMNSAMLDGSTYIYDASAFKPANNTGYTTLPYAGDNLDANGNGVNAVAFLEEMTAAEMDGRAYYNPALARMVYLHRNWWNYQAIVDALPTFYIPQADMLPESVYARDVNINTIEVVAYPRSIGTAGSTLYAIAAPFRISKSDNRQIVARFKDPAQPDKSCGATTIVTPVAGTDYIANTRSDGTGAVATSSVGISLSRSTNSVVLNISNNDPVNDIFITTLQIRGTPIQTGDAVTLKANYPAVIASQGFRKETRTIGATGNLEDVQQYADAYVRRLYVDSWQRITIEVDNQDSNFQAGYVLGVLYPDCFGPLFLLPSEYASPFGPFGLYALSSVPPDLVGSAAVDTAKVSGGYVYRTYSIISRANRIDVDSGRWTLDLIVQPEDSRGAFILNFADRATLDSNAILGF